MERTFQTLRGGDHGRVLLSELRTADGGDCTSKCTRLSRDFAEPVKMTVLLSCLSRLPRVLLRAKVAASGFASNLFHAVRCSCSFCTHAYYAESMQNRSKWWMGCKFANDSVIACDGYAERQRQLLLLVEIMAA